MPFLYSILYVFPIIICLRLLFDWIEIYLDFEIFIKLLIFTLFKLFIDYDKKITVKDDLSTNSVLENQSEIQHKIDIQNIIKSIKSEIPEITDVYILKSIPDTLKKSYHIIFDGVYFESREDMGLFIKSVECNTIKKLVDKKMKYKNKNRSPLSHTKKYEEKTSFFFYYLCLPLTKVTRQST